MGTELLVPEIAEQSLITGSLFKAAKAVEAAEDGWSFRGIASDESEDTDGDEILRNMIDLDYASARGYVNWNHSREPQDQIGYLTKIVPLTVELRKQLEDQLGTVIDRSATLYTEGSLYPHVEKARHVRDILRSTPGTGYHGGLGQSLDGSLARDPHSKRLIKAFVRGVALTPYPAQKRTLCQLAKMIKADQAQNQLPTGGMNLDEATLWLLKSRPHWTYEAARQVARHAMANTNGGVDK